MFLNDEKTVDAVVRNLEILGEATKMISKEFREKYPEIEWKKIAGIRNRVIHQYFGVSLEIIWEIMRQDIPGLYKN